MNIWIPSLAGPYLGAALSWLAKHFEQEGKQTIQAKQAGAGMI
jgi:hypothetical protein